ncbi:hypothetical protein CCACVL1_06229 [Corchorus capsularis]|uniref:Uncharacterized protein n=1 Tax=Corchorus capsularis TaxID=210143 RepID=A0A1R3JGP1_COCAP|nr:hypothetical protein CCACVL1_06229 [Corchorus capsularis]
MDPSKFIKQGSKDANPESEAYQIQDNK